MRKCVYSEIRNVNPDCIIMSSITINVKYLGLIVSVWFTLYYVVYHT